MGIQVSALSFRAQNHQRMLRLDWRKGPAMTLALPGMRVGLQTRPEHPFSASHTQGANTAELGMRVRPAARPVLWAFPRWARACTWKASG